MSSTLQAVRYHLGVCFVGAWRYRAYPQDRVARRVFAYMRIPDHGVPGAQHGLYSIKK
jgi:hypothetical protein